jgi:hypothetical protein
VAQVQGEVRTANKDGCPGASPLGTWESTDLGLGKLKSFISHRLLPASRPALTDRPDTHPSAVFSRKDGVSTNIYQQFADNYLPFPHNKENGQNPAAREKPV